jgi:decaprenylphospho-beta-D-erythro-pentofuranosid-2-ulose 2-reductase
LGEPEGDERAPAQVARSVADNFAWPAAAMAATAEHLLGQGRGRIVVLSSVAGVRVRLANFVYGSAKAGLDGFAWGLAATLRQRSGGVVSIQIVRPGFVHSKMTAGRRPAPFATTPAAVAEAVVTGIERSEPVIWVPPVLRVVFGLLRLLPDPIWRRLPG